MGGGGSGGVSAESCSLPSLAPPPRGNAAPAGAGAGVPASSPWYVGIISF